MQAPPAAPSRRPRPRRRESATTERNLDANARAAVDSSDVSVEPLTDTPTTTTSPRATLLKGSKSPTKFPTITSVESEKSEDGMTNNNTNMNGKPPRRLRRGVAGRRGEPWTADDLERLYRNIKITRRDLRWSTVGERVGQRTAGECSAKWREIEGRITEFIRGMGEEENAGDADESEGDEYDRLGDDEWEVDDLGSDYVDDEEMEERGGGDEDEGTLSEATATETE